MLELAKRLRLDLPDTLAVDAELLPDFLQPVISNLLARPPDWLRATLHADVEVYAQNALLARLS